MAIALVVLGVVVGALIVVGVVAEICLRVVARRPCRVGFYGSVPRDVVKDLQAEVGVRTNSGPGWVHLGWIADPDREHYVVERRDGCVWSELGQTGYGSFLSETGGTFRVRAVRSKGASSIVGEASIDPVHGDPPVLAPRIAGAWRPLFRPSKHGDYINDHCIFQDADGNWRLVGITARGRGNFNQEKYLGVGVAPVFPPDAPAGMREDTPVADFEELAWAPCALCSGSDWWLFWSPHIMHRMHSDDGVSWTNHEVVLDSSRHPFFRDPEVVEVAPGQWLCYATARGRWFSRVDVYQSFDLRHWQYARPALQMGRGSERNAPFASTESPTVMRNLGRWYLAVTYTNQTWGVSTLLLLLRVRRDNSYNDTRIFHSANPYDFGIYGGSHRAPTLVADIEAHAPEFVHHPDTGDWWITTAGWPRAATLTSGEVAVAPLTWDRA